MLQIGATMDNHRASRYRVWTTILVTSYLVYENKEYLHGRDCVWPVKYAPTQTKNPYLLRTHV